MANRFYLRVGDDYLEDAVPYRSRAAAVAAYADEARQLARYDQRLEASIHIADSMDEVAEYPDFALSLGPRGGVRVERC
jgi:hypothetical protein